MRSRAFLLGATLVLSGTFGAAAREIPETRPSASIEEVLAQGFAHVDAWRFQDAEAAFDEALARARQEGSPRLEAEARRGRGTSLSRQSRFQEAWAELHEARELFEATGDRAGLGNTQRNLGGVAFALGKADEARTLYQQALESAQSVLDRAGEAEALRSLAFVRGSTREGLAFIERAWEALQGLDDRKREGLVLHTWGDLLFLQGEYQAALQKLEAAAIQLEEVGDQASLARVHVSLGRLLRAHGQHERALEHYRHALRIQEALGDREGVRQSVNAVGVGLSNLGRKQEALLYYQRALALARELGSQVPGQLCQLGSVYVTLGEPARGVLLLEEALRLGMSQDSPCRSDLARGLSELGRQEEALRHATEALAAARAAGHVDSVLVALGTRAWILERMGRLEPALDDVRDRLGVIDGLRERVLPGDPLKRSFGEAYQSTYDLGVRILDTLGRHEEALETAEKARGRAFLDLLASRDAPAPRNAPVPSLPEIARAAKTLRSTLVAYWVGGESTIAWVVTPDGRVRRHRVDIPASRLARLVENASSGLAGPVSRGAAESPESGSPASERQVEADDALPEPGPAALQLTLRGGGTVSLDGRATRASRKLYDLLLRPLRDDLPSSLGARLTIVGHGPLLKLSFAGLQDEKGRYLLESYALHYTPAVGALSLAEPRQMSGDTEKRALLVADPLVSPALAAEHKLGPLAGARREARDVARLLSPREVDVWTGSAAGEGRIRQAMGDKAIIHFATHGVVRDDDPSHAFLALSRDPGGTADGRLTADEIYGLRLDADLVFLSACRTASGQVTGDGVVGLTRAFLSAGTPSVVATLWDVSDDVAREVVRAFYTSLRRTGDKAASLREAQLTVLRALRLGKLKVKTPAGDLVLPEHPALWAAFVLQGQP